MPWDINQALNKKKNGLINSEGWKLKPYKLSHRFEPLISYSKNKITNKIKIHKMMDSKEKRRRNLISKNDTIIMINIPIIEKIRCLFKNKYESLREKERITPMSASINIRTKFNLSICCHQSIIFIFLFINQ